MAEEPEKIYYSARMVLYYIRKYRMHDRKLDEFITIEELGDLMRSVGRIISDIELVEIVDRIFHVEKEDKIDFILFLKVMHHTKDKDDMLWAFEAFDIDGDGYITVDEVRLAMAKIGEVATDDELKEMIATVENNSNGEIRYEKFVDLIRRTRR